MRPHVVLISLSLALVACLSSLQLFADSNHPSEARPQEVAVYFYTAANCPHCQEMRPHLIAILDKYPQARLVEKDIWQDREAFQQLIDLLAVHGDLPVSTPSVFVGEKVWVGFNPHCFAELEQVLSDCVAQGCPDALEVPGEINQSAQPIETTETALVELPLLGTLDAREVSLPLVTVVLGLLDSFNPCAFFVLLFLLSLLVHVHSRVRMLIVGLVFVVFSGLVYFLFMAAWLNLFLATGGLRIVTLLAGLLAVVVGVINIKDYFKLHEGVSLSMSEKDKSKLYERVRKLVQVGRYPALLGGTVVLAIAANSYELLCTAGFPMVYTRILTLQELPTWEYYTYLAIYNIVYVIPLLLIVGLFALTLGAHKLTEREGKVLKLISGVMMAELGLVLLLLPGLLNNLWGTVLLLGGAIFLVTLIIGSERWWRNRLHG